VEVGGTVVQEPDITVTDKEGGEDKVFDGFSLVLERLKFEVFIMI
jgi:hypothetical protein